MIPSSQRRCFVTSAVFHGLVITAAALLSAFTPSAKSTLPNDGHFITIISDSVPLTGQASAGGSPTAGSPTQKPTPSISPPPPRETEPVPPHPAPKLSKTTLPPPKDPPKRVVPPPEVTSDPIVKPPKSDTLKRGQVSDKIVPNPDVKPQDVDLDRPRSRPAKPYTTLATTPVASSDADGKKARQKTEDSARKAKELADAKRQAQRDAAAAQARADWESAQAARREALQNSIKGLGQSIAGTMKIELPGPGGGGAVVAGYADYVKSVFQAAWNRNRPATLAAKSAQSRVSLVIRRDGSFTYKILTPSQVPDVDTAIGRLLRQQGPLRAFPSDFNQEDVEIIVTFNLESSASG